MPAKISKCPEDKRLEISCTFTGTVGSNPTVSAKKKWCPTGHHFFFVVATNDEPRIPSGMLRFCEQAPRQAPIWRKTGVQNPTVSAKQKAVPFMGAAFLLRGNNG